MITGFNTDVKHRNRVFHIQTEDKGESNPCVESLVYVGGEILATKRTSYAEVMKVTGRDDHAVQDLMEQQHRTMIAAIQRGPVRRAQRRHPDSRGHVSRLGARAGTQGRAPEQEGGRQGRRDRAARDALAAARRTEASTR